MKLLGVDLKSRWYVTVLTLFYISLVLFVSFVGVGLFFPDRLDGRYTGASHNFVPLSTIGTYLINIQNYNFDTWFYNTFGTVLLFVPIGILILLLFSKLKAGIALVVILIFSLFIETVQYITKLGVFDVDDIILNTSGVLLGILICSFLKKRKKLLN
ncbi:VanZ family protein [Cytobacillus suaedae]|nr:VanZ family protein [Cytobacillus suaedae]